MRVLSQDGFLTTSLAPKSAATREGLASHFSQNLFAAACIARRENGHWHWVILGGIIDGHLLVGDSLRHKEGFYREPYDDFMNNHVFNILTVEANPDWPLSGASTAHSHIYGWHSRLSTAAVASPWALGLLPLSLLLGWPSLLTKLTISLTWPRAFAATSSTTAIILLGAFLLAYVDPLGLSVTIVVALAVGSLIIHRATTTPRGKALALLAMSACCLALIIGALCLVTPMV